MNIAERRFLWSTYDGSCLTYHFRLLECSFILFFLNQVGFSFSLRSVWIKSESRYFFMITNENSEMVLLRAWILPMDMMECMSVTNERYSGLKWPWLLKQTLGSFAVQASSTLSIRRAFLLTSPRLSKQYLYLSQCWPEYNNSRFSSRPRGNRNMIVLLNVPSS